MKPVRQEHVKTSRKYREGTEGGSTALSGGAALLPPDGLRP